VSSQYIFSIRYVLLCDWLGCSNNENRYSAIPQTCSLVTQIHSDSRDWTLLWNTLLSHLHKKYWHSCKLLIIQVFHTQKRCKNLSKVNKKLIPEILTNWKLYNYQYTLLSLFIQSDNFNITKILISRSQIIKNTCIENQTGKLWGTKWSEYQS